MDSKTKLFSAMNQETHPDHKLVFLLSPDSFHYSPVSHYGKWVPVLKALTWSAENMTYWILLGCWCQGQHCARWGMYGRNAFKSPVWPPFTSFYLRVSPQPILATFYLKAYLRSTVLLLFSLVMFLEEGKSELAPHFKSLAFLVRMQSQKPFPNIIIFWQEMGVFAAS